MSWSRRQQQIICLRCDQGLTIKEVAAEIGVAVNTIKNHGTEIQRKAAARTFYQVCTAHGRSGDPPVAGMRPSDV